MNLSTRGRYATRAMLELAQHYGEDAVSSEAISRAQGISMRYLQQLLGTLKRSGLVRVTLGPGGGFALAAPPDQIRIGDVLDAVEGHFSLVECVEDETLCPRAPNCLSRGLWVEASQILNRYFQSMTLADVLARHSPRPRRRGAPTPSRARSRGARRNAGH
jgi:Rrf2 family cysteine metabolism transcriptional repressor